MKGLIIKDLYLAKKYCRSLALFVVIFSLMQFMNSENILFVLMPVMVGGILPVTLIAYDEQAKWTEFAGTLPCTKSEYVEGKYVIGLMGFTATALITLIVHIICAGTANVGAFVGIIGLILGFGAQSLIEDVITGLFIIFEGKYMIGDIIVLDDFRGTVRDIGVRTTTIEDAGKNLKVVNNSDIRNFQNRSRNSSYAACEVSVSYDTDLRQLEKILSENLPAMYEAHKDIYLAAPRYLGVSELADSGVNIKFVVEVREQDIFTAQRALTRDVRILFADKGIEIPFPQVDVHMREK